MIAETTGDGRTALSMLEDVIYASDEIDDKSVVETETVSYCIKNKGFTHDKKGDIYYNLLSGLQKSIRGSDVDAALYYLARLLEGGDIISYAVFCLKRKNIDIELAILIV